MRTCVDVASVEQTRPGTAVGVQLEELDIGEEWETIWRRQRIESLAKRHADVRYVHVTSLTRCPGFTASRRLHDVALVHRWEDGEFDTDEYNGLPPLEDLRTRQDEWNMLSGTISHVGLQAVWTRFASRGICFVAEVTAKDRKRKITGSVDYLFSGNNRYHPVLLDQKAGRTWARKTRDKAEALQVNTYRVLLGYGQELSMYIMETKYGVEEVPGFHRNYTQAKLYPPEFVPVRYDGNVDRDLDRNLEEFWDTHDALSAGKPPAYCRPSYDGRGRLTWQCKRKYCMCASCPTRE